MKKVLILLGTYSLFEKIKQGIMGAALNGTEALTREVRQPPHIA
jgi:hypothetical protein